MQETSGFKYAWIHFHCLRYGLRGSRIIWPVLVYKPPLCQTKSAKARLSDGSVRRVRSDFTLPSLLERWPRPLRYETVNTYNHKWRKHNKQETFGLFCHVGFAQKWHLILWDLEFGEPTLIVGVLSVILVQDRSLFIILWFYKLHPFIVNFH